MSSNYYDAVTFIPKRNIRFHGFGLNANYNGKDITYKICWAIADEKSEEFEVET